jgi:hypothetical protein
MNAEKTMPTVEQSGRALLSAHAILDALGVRHHIDGGTLLGFYRDGTFAQDDHDDIDITTSANNWHKHEEIHKTMLANGFTLYHKWDRDEARHRSGQYAWKRGNVKIDLMFKEVKEDKIWWTVYGGPNKVTYKAIPIAIAEMMTTRRFKVPYEPGVYSNPIFEIPRLTDDYLAYRYGDWKVPVHRKDYSCYTTDRCIVKENTYEAI